MSTESGCRGARPLGCGVPPSSLPWSGGHAGAGSGTLTGAGLTFFRLARPALYGLFLPSRLNGFLGGVCTGTGSLRDSSSRMFPRASSMYGVHPPVAHRVFMLGEGLRFRSMVS